MSRAEVYSVKFAASDEAERAVAVAPAICGSTLEINVLEACEEEFRPTMDRIPGLVVTDEQRASPRAVTFHATLARCAIKI
jgi:hypothetical protein